MKGDESGFNYTELAQRARTIPSVPEGGPSNVTEIHPVFKGNEVTDHPYIEKEIPKGKAAPKTHFLAFTKVFVLWRPWEKCARCLKAIDNDPSILPEYSDYSCPHTQQVAYKELIDRGLSGDSVLTSKEAFNLPNGTRCVHLEWIEPDPKQKKKIEEAEAKKKESRVYPPDVAGFMSGKK
jgi:hypothetical protein